jgi:hypothetical protein
VDPIIETPTSSRLRTTKPNSRLAQPDLASDRIVLSDDLRLYIRHAWHVVEPSMKDRTNTTNPTSVASFFVDFTFISPAIPDHNPRTA